MKTVKVTRVVIMTLLTFLSVVFLPYLVYAQAAPMVVDSPEKYTVREGDSLTKIAREQCGNVSLWRKVAEDNNLKNPDHIEVEQVLTISCAKSAGTKVEIATNTAAANPITATASISSVLSSQDRAAAPAEVIARIEMEDYSSMPHFPAINDQGPIQDWSAEKVARIRAENSKVLKEAFQGLHELWLRSSAPHTKTEVAPSASGQTASAQDSPAETTAPAQTPTSLNTATEETATTQSSNDEQEATLTQTSKEKVTAYQLTIEHNFAFTQHGAPRVKTGENLKTCFLSNGELISGIFSFAQAKGKKKDRYIVLYVPSEKMPSGKFSLIVDGFGTVDGAKFLERAIPFKGKIPGPPSKFHRMLNKVAFTAGKISLGGVIMTFTIGGGNPLIGFGASAGAWAIPTISRAYFNAKDKRNAANLAQSDEDLQVIQGKQEVLDAALHNLHMPKGGN